MGTDLVVAVCNIAVSSASKLLPGKLGSWQKAAKITVYLKNPSLHLPRSPISIKSSLMPLRSPTLKKIGKNQQGCSESTAKSEKPAVLSCLMTP